MTESANTKNASQETENSKCHCFAKVTTDALPKNFLSLAAMPSMGIAKDSRNEVSWPASRILGHLASECG